VKNHLHSNDPTWSVFNNDHFLTDINQALADIDEMWATDFGSLFQDCALLLASLSAESSVQSSPSDQLLLEVCTCKKRPGICLEIEFRSSPRTPDPDHSTTTTTTATTTSHN
jgi:hypothetical protein